MSDSKIIVDRVATDGDWRFEAYKHTEGRKPRKGHYFNEGSQLPVCGEPSFRHFNRTILAVMKSVHTTVVDALDDDSEHHRTCCGNCKAIVFRGVDNRANNARMEFGLELNTEDPAFVTPYTFHNKENND